MEPRCPIIFTTAYDEYAVQAFKLNSLDYLLKPIVPRELEVALMKFKRTTVSSAPSALDFGQLVQALKLSQRTYRQRFLISYRDTYQAIAAREVAYFSSDNKGSLERCCSFSALLNPSNVGESRPPSEPLNDRVTNGPAAR